MAGERLDLTLRIWGTLFYLTMHKGDSPSSRNRGISAIAAFLRTNYLAAKEVLEFCF